MNRELLGIDRGTQGGKVEVADKKYRADMNRELLGIDKGTQGGKVGVGGRKYRDTLPLRNFDPYCTF